MPIFRTDLTFPHCYAFEEVGEFPGNGVFDAPVIHFPRPTSRADHNGLWLRVRGGNGKSWIGVFTSLFDSPVATSWVSSTPDPESICVVVGSTAYLVKADAPDTWTKEECVLSLQPLLEQQLLILVGYTDLVAYGPKGRVWWTKRLCWDEPRIVAVSDTTIEGWGTTLPIRLHMNRSLRSTRRPVDHCCHVRQRTATAIPFDNFPDTSCP